MLAWDKGVAARVGYQETEQLMALVWKPIQDLSPTEVRVRRTATWEPLGEVVDESRERKKETRQPSTRRNHTGPRNDRERIL